MGYIIALVDLAGVVMPFYVGARFFDYFYSIVYFRVVYCTRPYS